MRLGQTCHLASRILRLFMLVTVLLASAIAASAFGRELVVDNRHPRAADSNQGSAQAPLKTIQRAADLVQPGDRVVVKAGRYPESYWGQLNLNYCIPYVLGRGKQGPVATARSEAFRENVQETQARITIERALLDEDARAALGTDLAARCRKVLDERIRMCLSARGEGSVWFVSSGWAQRTKELFRLAGEVSRRTTPRDE